MEETNLPMDMMMEPPLSPDPEEPSLQLLCLTNNIILIAEVAEVLAEVVGQPDCKLIKPYLVEDGKLTPWLSDVTDDQTIMMSSDKILTMVEPKKTLLDEYQSLTK